MTETILITGAKGQLGSDCVPSFASTRKVIAWSRDELDITAPASIALAMKAHRPSIVLNCAAFTQVDACETERDTAFRVNGEAPGHLARACAEHGAYLIHISTDYVFDGTRPVPTPYTEDDPVAPVSVYGASKLAGEQAVLAAAPDAAIVRTSWVYGMHGHNFLKAVLSRALSAPDAPMRVVNDQHGSPTWTVRLAEQ
ncbi:MAG: dTDP-4-dehydrorhamnose reductase, partial [Verrucomicrobia bacterium]|nr:dTDP-4-dehydrorhamnose reductase [Verrucomicrobiota bacterium]